MWSPDCPPESSAPTPAGSSAGSETSTFDVGDFIGYDPYNPDANETDANATETSEPTKEPTLSDEKPNFVKPSGGKKPPPNKKPGSTSSGTSGKGDSVSAESSDTPAPTPVPTLLPGTDSPTPLPVLSPDDPAATYFCGDDWINANEVCEIRCPSAKSEDCPGSQSCYAFTSCNDPPPSPSPIFSGNATETVDDNDPEAITDSSPAASNATASSPAAAATSNSSSTGALTEDPECTGQPCELVGECRSQFGFCGGSFIYCNDLSSWSMEKCGLFGTDENGETILCGADVKDCPGGERVIRNPLQGCDYFPCPASEKEAESLGGFVVPGPAPTLPELPKPTLPTIVDPKKPDFNLGLGFGSTPSDETIDFGIGSPSKDSDKVVVISDEEDVTDDQDQSSKITDETAVVGKNDPFSGNFDSFSYEEWLAGDRSGGLRASMTRLSCVISSVAVLLIIY